MCYLDVKVSREKMNYVTNIYRKGVLYNFHSFIGVPYKYGLIYSLLYHCFKIRSDWKKFHYEINKLKSIFSKNNYPNNIIDFCIKIFLNKLHHCKKSIITVPKEDICLLFLGSTSLEIRTKLRSLFSKKLPLYTLWIIFRSSCRLKKISISKTKFLSIYIQVSFKNLCVLAAFPPIMVKPNAILKYEPAKTWEYPLALARIISPLRMKKDFSVQ